MPRTNPPDPSHYHDEHLRPLWDDPEGVYVEDGYLHVTLECDYTVDHEQGNERVGPIREVCGHTETVTYRPATSPDEAPLCPVLSFEHDDPSRVSYPKGRAVFNEGEEDSHAPNGWCRCDPSIESIDSPVHGADLPDEIVVEGKCDYCHYDVAVTYVR